MALVILRWLWPARTAIILLHDGVELERTGAGGSARSRVRHRARDDAGRHRRCRSPSGWRTSSRKAGTATWRGWRTTAERRRHPLALWPQARSIIMLGMNYAPKAIRSPRSTSRGRGAISCYAQCSDYHDVINPASSAWPAGWRSESGAEVKVFVDTAPLMEKPLAEAAGLGWQGKHTNLVSREYGSWLFLGAILTIGRDASRRAGGRPLRHLPALPRRLPDQCLPGALPARCAPLHRLPDHRAQGPHPRGVSPGDRQPRVRLRRLPRRVPVEQVRRGRARDQAAGAGAGRRPAARRAAGARRCRLPRALRRHAGQAHGPRPRRAQCADRRRQLRRYESAAGRRAPARRCLPLVRAMAVWALQRLAAPSVGIAKAPHVAHETDADVRAEWAAEVR